MCQLMSTSLYKCPFCLHVPDKKCHHPLDSFSENYFSFSDDSDSDVVGTPMIENLVEGMGLQLYPEQNLEGLVAEFKCSCK